MELETMFVEQKWNIIRELSAKPSSPLQLSETLGTSMANISQQLRLLEAANLVGKQKIKNRDKGKPRSMFSLTGDYGYLIAASHKFAKKGLVALDNDKRAILQIWFTKNDELHVPLQSLYWGLHDALNDVEAIVLAEKDLAVTAYVCCKKPARKKIDELVQPHVVDNLKIRVVGIDEMRTELASAGSAAVFILFDHRDSVTDLV